MTVRDLRDLKIWQKAMDLAERVYAIAARLPKSEVYGLAAQLQSAGVSIPSNIAEAHAPESRKEFLRYLAIARGSLAELDTQLELAHRLSRLPSEDFDDATRMSAGLARMLRGMEKSVKELPE